MQRTYRLIGLSLLIALTFAAAGWADGTAASNFEKLKSLAGHWQGTTADGKTATLDISLIAGGHTVMERFAMPGLGLEDPSRSMYTMYHLDEEDLMLVHYCVSKNQPRMRSLPTEDPNVLAFEFFDSTNMPDPNAGHMYKAQIQFIDDRHITTEWSYRKDGKEAYSVAVSYERAE